MPIAVDHPAGADRSPELSPQPSPRARRSWWRFLFPWIRTAVGAPADDDRLIVDNRTDLAWMIHLGYRRLGRVAPHTTLAERVVKAGMLSARQADAPVGTEYLTIWLTPTTQVVQILDLGHEEGLYELSLLAAE
ncbi:MAG: hypothetical protein JOZ41_14520 [Chloroflexi bacterium]|nr:hypothetical protein [Chloroflexota bacterium]